MFFKKKEEFKEEKIEGNSVTFKVSINENPSINHQQDPLYNKHLYTIEKDYGFKPTPVDESKPIEQYTKKEAQLMFEWYLDDLPKRTEYLFDYINQTESIELKYDIETFKKVMKWFENNVTVTYKNEKEMALETSLVPEIVRGYIPNYEFTEDTLLLIAVIGGYLGQVMIQEIPNTKWIIDKYKKSPTYNRAVIVKESGEELPTVTIMENFSRRIVDGRNLGVDEAIEAWCL